MHTYMCWSGGPDVHRVSHRHHPDTGHFLTVAIWGWINGVPAK